MSETAEVTIFEKSHRLGGVIETLHEGGNLIETGADNFATLIPDALELTEKFGSPELLLKPQPDDRRAFVLRNGMLHPIPAGFSLMQPTKLDAILSTPTLSIPGRIRVLFEYFVKSRENTDKDESLESFATRRLGREAFENLVEPIVCGIFTADPRTLSMQATMSQFLSMEAQHGGLIRGHIANKKKNGMAQRASGARYEQFRAPSTGMSSWIEDLADSLPQGCTRFNCEIQSLEKTANGWEIKVDDQVEVFDAVVLATPAKISAQLLEHCAPRVSDLVGQVDYASSAIAALIVDRKEIYGRIDGFGAIVPSKENRNCLAISYSSNKYPGRVEEKDILLRVFMGGVRQSELLNHSDERLVEMALQEICDVLNWRGHRPKWSKVIRWPESMPQYTLGHVSRRTKIEEYLNGLPGLALCGAAYEGVGIPQCVRSGKKAALRILSA